MVYDSDRAGSYDLYTMRVDGTDDRLLLRDGAFDSWWPRISPDRTRILFYRTPKGVHDTDYTQASMWMVNADGTNVRQLRPRGTDGWGFQGHGEWSPDGTRIVMIGGSLPNLQLFVTDAGGGSARALTQGPGLRLDPSWSPDGRTIVFTGCQTSGCSDNALEVYTIPATGGAETQLTHDGLRDHDPYFSPDGRTIAWLCRTDPTGPIGVWNIKIMLSDGSGQHAVTNDSQINSKPSWSPDGTRIYFHRFEYARSKWDIYSIRPDGTGMTRISTGTGNNEFPSP